MNMTHNTILLWDWDDTLFPNSWLNSGGYQVDHNLAHVPASVLRQLEALDAVVVEVLQSSTKTGRVVIVTNAETGWVELSSKKFLPRTSRCLQTLSLPIVSARSSYEEQFPASPVDWKIACFDKLLQSFAYGNAAAMHQRSVISFGDSVVERSAVRHACCKLPQTWTKSIKFVEAPTAEHLQREIELIQHHLSYIQSHEGDLDMMLTVELLASYSGTAAQPAPEGICR